MLKNLDNVKWVGMLSLEDADVLAGFAATSNAVLEFGVGGSTLIFSQKAPSSEAVIYSVETDINWIKKVETLVSYVHVKREVKIDLYRDSATYTYEPKFDLIFVDGVKGMRGTFATKAWSSLKPGGVILFHDTKRNPYLREMLDFVEKHVLEISSMEYNVPASNNVASNITVIRKALTPAAPANDFQSSEGERETWTFSSNLTAQEILDKGFYVYKNS